MDSIQEFMDTCNSDNTCNLTNNNTLTISFAAASFASSSSSSATATAGSSSRYENQKRRDWITFGQYLKNHRPPLSLSRCSSAHVLEFLRYLDQFGKTKVHAPICPFYGHPNPAPAPCPCPLRQAWGSLDALIGRLRAAFEENGGKPEANPFGERAVRLYIHEVRDLQSKARGVSHEKKKRKLRPQHQQSNVGGGVLPHMPPPVMMESDSKSDVAKLEKMGDLSIPPGFGSLTSFLLKRDGKVKEIGKSSTVLNESEHEPDIVESERVINDIAAYNKRPWILLDQSNHKADESDMEHLPMDHPSNACRPKGTILGCSNCKDCLKVVARWHPDDAKREVLKEAPVFNPTEEEFKDTVKYIANIRSRVEHYGCCRIIPPPCWKPPCSLEEKNIWEGSKFAAKVQRIDGLQVQHAQETVANSTENIKTKRRRDTKVSLGSQHGNAGTCTIIKQVQDVEDCVPDPGFKFTLKTFKKFADEFKTQYFNYIDKNKTVGCDLESALHGQKWEPSLENIEGEYGRIVQNPTDEIEVLCGNTLEAGVFNSGFPKIRDPLEEYSHPDAEYLKSGWNLNNIHSLPGSLISFESSKASHNFASQVHVGMCFSSHSWKVEEHQLYSLSYTHLGEPKVWYCVPRRYAVSFEAIRKKYLRDLCERQPDVHENLMTLLPCSILKAEGIPVYRCVQYPQEFVLIFPGAYHSGFDCGFNCSESVSFAPLEWLLHAQNVVEQYCEQRRKMLISYDKLLLEAAREAVRAQWEIDLCMESRADKSTCKDAYQRDGILVKALGSRIRSESIKREYLCKSLKSQRMDKNFGASCKRVCIVCLRDLHLSAVGCSCSENKYACLDHAKQLCPCTWSNKILLYRYEISELNVLHQALEGKLSSVYKWAKEDLGLSFQSAASKRSKPTPEETCSKPPPSQDSKMNDTKSKLVLDTNNAISKWKQQKSQATSNPSEMKQNEVASRVMGARPGTYSSPFSIQPKENTTLPESTFSDKSTISKKVTENSKVSTTYSPVTNLRYMSFLKENPLLQVSSDSSSSSSASESDAT